MSDEDDLVIITPSDIILHFIEEGDQTIIFNTKWERNEYLEEIAKKKLPDSKSNIYIKLFCIYEDINIWGLSNIINIYKDIHNLDITPALIECKKLIKYRIGYFYENTKIYEDEYDDKIGSVYMITTEAYGISLADKYSINGIGPGCTTSNFNKYCDFYFPPDKIPEHIRNQIKTLIKCLRRVGWNHEDIHPGNFLIQNDIVKIIDFECAKRSNFTYN
jgi:serine/threonine protein kinase